METKNSNYYLITKLDGKECSKIVNGWPAVRAMIAAGRKPKFHTLDSELHAKLAKEDIDAERAIRDDRQFYRIPHPKSKKERGELVEKDDDKKKGKKPGRQAKAA